MMMMMNRSSNRLLYHKRQQSTNNDKKIMIKKKKTTKNHKKQKVKCIQYIIVSLFAGFFILYLQSFKRIFIQITETKKMKMNDNNNINEKTKKIISSLYNPSKIMFLNTTNNDASILRDYQPIVNNDKKNKKGGNYEIDILTIGSISSINRAKVQMKTWGSHISRRHYWLATELDDPDPTCHTSMSLDDVTTYSHTCSKNARKYWESHGSWNYLTSYLKNVFAQPQWLLEKKNPQGWICAQKRFLFALSKLLALYRDGRDQYGVDLPAYLIFGDDDTYVNLEMIEDELLRTPNVIVKEKGYTMDDELHMVYPTQNTPVVWAGCRVRRPTNIIHDTFPFGGFGVMISKGAIERLIQPLNCNNNEVKVGFEAEACDHWTPPYTNWSIAEYQFFKPGMSVSDLMGSYVKNMQPFCLHSDWGIGYFVNHFNISRHVVPTLQLHDGLDTNQQKAYWYNDQMGDIKHARLHAWDDGSESYMRPRGNCHNIRKRCNEKSRACHQMDEILMERVHRKVKQSFPQKYRDL